LHAVKWFVLSLEVLSYRRFTRFLALSRYVYHYYSHPAKVAT
jgi:hypothetical protein